MIANYTFMTNTNIIAKNCCTDVHVYCKSVNMVTCMLNFMNKPILYEENKMPNSSL